MFEAFIPLLPILFALPPVGGKRDKDGFAPELLPTFGAGSMLRLGVVGILDGAPLEYNLRLGEGMQELGVEVFPLLGEGGTEGIRGVVVLAA